MTADDIKATADNRKATDILLNIESHTNEILAYIRNLDLKYNILLDKVNKITNMPTASVVEEFPEFKQTSIKEEKPLRSGLVQLPKGNPSPFQPAPDLKAKLQAAMKEAAEQNNKQVSTQIPTSTRVIPTYQKVAYEDGKAVYMAGVEIYGSDGVLIKKSTTDQVGKWKEALLPGEYLIKVNKSGNNKRPQVNMEYKINIPIAQTAPLDLGTKTVEM